jgi:hypothetical protein
MGEHGQGQAAAPTSLPMWSGRMGEHGQGQAAAPTDEIWCEYNDGGNMGLFFCYPLHHVVLSLM